ncbi:2-amino-3-carboxymuconate-6-semialdehyde decarboxylase [Algibacter lectus]|uniref:2-amino-3-carboxymuconate-6-semialdehyde decarboxylase n=1 Tax=Algibacter lectus TaxID=221126 RepID=A0A090WX27_9FLAO|nr:2-amino-3-carboxymuconate-6-semialdehyde decarboxylase [Algibacter lectus]
MQEKGIFWVDKDRKFMLQKDWKRPPVTDSSFFLDEKLEWMERNKLDHAVVLNLSQLYGNGLRVEEMKKALRFQNDFNARIQREHPPSKFTCGFVVHPGFIRSACWEIERCVETHGMQLLCLPTHYMDTIGTWRCIFDEENEPIFELANKYNLAVEIHPYDGGKIYKIRKYILAFSSYLDVGTMWRCISFFNIKRLSRKISKHAYLLCSWRTVGAN